MGGALSRLNALVAEAYAQRGPKGEVAPRTLPPDTFDALWADLRADPLMAHLIEFRDGAPRSMRLRGVVFVRGLASKSVPEKTGARLIS